MDLKDTVELMLSEDRVDIFKAEYYQTKIRYEKLHEFIIKYEASSYNPEVLGFTPDTPLSIIKDQAKYMGMYLYQLEVRAQLEGIEL